jgi:hypothetical protein
MLGSAESSSERMNSTKRVVVAFGSVLLVTACSGLRAASPKRSVPEAAYLAVLDDILPLLRAHSASGWVTLGDWQDPTSLTERSLATRGVRRIAFGLGVTCLSEKPMILMGPAVAVGSDKADVQVSIGDRVGPYALRRFHVRIERWPMDR